MSTDTVHKSTTDTHKCLHTREKSAKKSNLVWRTEPDSEGFYLRFGWG